MLTFVVMGAMALGIDMAGIFGCACVLAGSILFALGACKAKFHDKRYLRSGLETVLVGGACAAAAFLIGKAISQWSSLHDIFPAVAPCKS